MFFESFNAIVYFCHIQGFSMPMETLKNLYMFWFISVQIVTLKALLIQTQH